MVKCLSLVTSQAGRYRLTLTAKPGLSGSYTLTLDEQRPATPIDPLRVKAQGELAAGLGEQLRVREWARGWFAAARRHALQGGDAELAAEAAVAGRGVDADVDPVKQFSAIVADLDAALRVASRPTVAAALDVAGRAQFGLGHLKEAIQLKQQAFALWQQLREPADAAEAATDLGYYLKDSNGEKAKEWFSKGLLLRRQAGDLVGEARTWTALGTLRAAQLDLEGAEEAYARAQELSHQAGARHDEAQAWSNLAAQSQRHGDLQTAIGQYEKSVDLGVEDRLLLGRNYHNLGSLYVEVGDLESAKVSYELALQQLPEGDPYYVNALINLGPLKLKEGKAKDALEELQRALRSSRDSQRGLALHYMGRAYLDLGRPQEAIDLLNQALEIRRQNGELQELAKTRIDIGKAYQAQGKRDLAAEQLTMALALARSTQNPAVEASCRFNRALLELDANHLDRALGEVDAALKILEPVRSRFARDRTRTSFSATLRDFYELKTALLLGQGRAREAFAVSERAHARGLLDLLAEGRIDVQGEVPQELRDQEAELDRDLYLTEEKIAAAKPDAKETVARLTQRRSEIELQQDALAGEIRRRNPRYAAVRQPTFVDASVLAGRLEERTALLEYLVGEGESWLFVVTRQGLASYPLKLSREDIAKRVKELRATISESTKLTRRSFCQRAANLYQQVFAPAASRLAGKSDLVIVPDGALHLLPFEVLLTEDACAQGAPPFAELPYLLREHTLSYVPSASVLEELRTPRPSPVAPPGGQALRFLAFANPITNLEALAQSQTEVDQIAGLYPRSQVREFVGREANKNNVRDWVTHADQIQFATHGQFDEERPELSGLVLTPGGKDGLLRVSEVFNLKLHADLVVLSGCETGLGQQVTGEGLVGLSRAFFYAGTPSLVVSLWRAADESTPRLMLDFYKRLNQGVDKGEALRRAKLAMLAHEEYSHPYHWAPFVLVGDPKSKK